MLDEVRAALNEIGARYTDPRVQYFQVAAAVGEDDGCLLSGAVLDSAAYAVLADGLIGRLPETCFDASSVRILRSPTPELATVATNLTGLYARPSFLAEQISQLLAGTQLEVLDLPATETAVPERWAFVRLQDGYLGWAYRPYLAAGAGQPAEYMIVEPVATLYAEPATGAPIVTRALAGALVCVLAQTAGWTHVALAEGLAGWAPDAGLRPSAALPADEMGRRRQMVADAGRFIGVPYLWGGSSAFGIDCSGLVQLVHRLSGVTLPRDADMQFEVGLPVEPPFEPGDLIYFGEGNDRRRATHVGMSLGGWRMIHSSRARNGVYIDDVQVVAHLRESYVGGRSFVTQAL